MKEKGEKRHYGESLHDIGAFFLYITFKIIICIYIPGNFVRVLVRSVTILAQLFLYFSSTNSMANLKQHDEINKLCNSKICIQQLICKLYVNMKD